MTPVKSQNGLSIIELLVALAISTILILGVTQVFLENKRTQAFQQQQNNNQENARFAEIILDEYLGKAGYRRAPDDVLENAFPAAAAASGCSAFTAGSSRAIGRRERMLLLPGKHPRLSESLAGPTKLYT